MADFYLNFTTLLVAVITLVVYALYRSCKRPAGFPPGPTALPIVGNMPRKLNLEVEFAESSK